MKRYVGISSLVVAVALGGSFPTGVAAEDATRSYVIVARGQGSGSTAIDDLVSAAGGTITGSLAAIGVVFASSSNSQFLAAVTADPRIQEAAEDVEVNWIPDEQVIELDADAASLPANHETFSALQWNLRQIQRTRRRTTATGATARAWRWSTPAS